MWRGGVEGGVGGGRAGRSGRQCRRGSLDRKSGWCGWNVGAWWTIWWDPWWGSRGRVEGVLLNQEPEGWRQTKPQLRCATERV